MKILNAVEQEAFESPPLFNSVQRKQYFDFPVALRHLAASLHARTHRLGFVLSSAYFQATKKFFSPADFRPFDQGMRHFLREEIVRMVRSQLKPKLILWRCGSSTFRTRSNQAP
jgi:hypothetical protein